MPMLPYTGGRAVQRFVPPERPMAFLGGDNPQVGTSGRRYTEGPQYGNELDRQGRFELTAGRQRQVGRMARSDRLAGAADQALLDPTGTADRFGSYFQTAAQGIAAPALRDFANTLSNVQGSTAARFGGNASTEETRNGFNASDLFSRNLSEALARLAPQQAQMGLDYAGQLQGSAAGAAGEEDRLRGDIIQLVGTQKPAKQKKSVLGTIAGTAAGIATKAALA